MSAASFFNPTPVISVPPRERPAAPSLAETPTSNQFDEALEKTPARPERTATISADETRPEVDARPAEERAETTKPSDLKTPDVEADTLPTDAGTASSDGVDGAQAQTADDDEPVLLSAELVGDTLEVKIAVPELLAEGSVGSAGAEPGEDVALPAWLDPFNSQAGLLSISLNTQPLVDGLVEGVAAVLPTLTGLAGQVNSGPNGSPSIASGVPILPAGEAGLASGNTPSGEGNTNGSSFGSSNTNNANAAANLNTAANSAGGFALPLAAETPAGGNTLLNNEIAPARNAAPTGATLSTAINSSGLTQAESNHDALNSARLTRGLNAAVNQQGGNITLRLTPPEMGTVRIQLNLTGGNVSAQFHAETESARTLLTQQLGQLRSTLEGQGLNVERLGVQGMNNTSNSSSLQQQQQNNQSQTQAEADGRSRGGQQQQPGGSSDDANPESQEERARDNLANARELFTDLIDATPEFTPEPTPATPSEPTTEAA